MDYLRSILFFSHYMQTMVGLWLLCQCLTLLDSAGGPLISGLTMEISSLPGTCFYGSRPKQQVKMNCENFFKTYVIFVHIHHLKRTGKYVPPEGGTRSQGNRRWRGKEREWIHLFKVFFLFFFLFWCGLYWICYNIASVLCFGVVFFLGRGACGVLSPQPGIKPAPLALEGEVLITGLPENSLHFNIVVVV